MRTAATWLIAIAITACSDEVQPPGDPFDGNVLIGDAPITDAQDDASADAGPPDAPDGAAPDAEPEDALNVPDSGPSDLGPPDGGDLCSEGPEQVLTATEAASMASALDGRLVDVVGTATTAGVGCTRIACTPADPCCNTCTASISIDGALLLRSNPCAPSVGCSGDECTLVCSPPLLGAPQRFRGVLRAGAPPGLELTRVLP